MKILLLGATGRTGKLLLDEFLQRGHTVHAAVRDKNKVNTASGLLTVLRGPGLMSSCLIKPCVAAKL